MTADFTYFPFLRTGLASAVTTPPANDPFVSLGATATVNGTAGSSVQLRLAGPGEIRGLDPRTVVRTDPVPGALGVPPNLFPTIELRPPDLPWMFTPQGATGARLRPWFCLIVTDVEETGEPFIDATKPLPILTVPHPDRVLPDPRDAWAWAYVAVAGHTDAAGLRASRAKDAVARLVCARRLEPERRYLAALVPVFDGGRLAGLGEQVDDKLPLKDAWSVTATGPLDLPVYYSWTFSTGVGGDFRSLALRLQGRPLPTGAGTRPMDITAPGGGLDPLPADAITTSLGLEGALQPTGFTPSDWDAGEQTSFAHDLASRIDDAITNRELGPPLWGRWQAAQTGFPTARPAWLRELNADPRCRAAAGFGARVVQDQREQLMAQAWKQVGEIERANQRLRHAQLARAHGKALHLHALPTMSDGTFLQVTRPLHDRVLVDKGQTAFGELRASSVPERLLDGAFRRVARPRGPLGRRLGRDTRDPGAVLEKAAGGVITTTPPPTPPSGSGLMVARVDRLPPAAIEQRSGPVDFQPLADWTHAPGGQREPGPDTAVMAAFRNSVAAYEGWRSGLERKPRPPRPSLDPPGLRGRIMNEIDPDHTVARRTRAVVTAPGWAGAGDPLEPILAAPRFPQPMSVPLTAISQELVLPGVQGIPAETVTAAVPNPRFIASYMVGLNHEMSRQLLFRAYPTDLRGTYFAQFWDVRGRVPAPAPGTTDDIGPIDQWLPANLLGMDVGGAAGMFVVIIRGELVRRYGDITVYAVPAKWSPAPPQTGPRPPLAPPSYPKREVDATAPARYPLIRGRLEPDLLYAGLQLSATDAIGTLQPELGTGPAGWFVVLEQQVVAPHYGLEDAPVDAVHTTPGSAQQVSWSDVTSLPPAPGAAQYAPAARPAWWTPPGSTAAGPTSWGASSAAMASITLQRPTRLAMHASMLVQP